MRLFVARQRRADEKGDLAANRLLLHACEEFGQITAQELLVDFGNFARDDRVAAAQAFQCVRKSVHEAMGRFIKRQRTAFLSEVPERLAARSGPGGEETYKQEFLRREP